MPKVKPSKTSHLKNLVEEFGANIFSTDGQILFCKICETRVAADKKFTVQQHIGRDKHQRSLKLEEKNKARQSLLIDSASNSNASFSEFFKELCEAFASANIPLNKVNNPIFKGFMEKYMQRSIPEESTLRRNYIPRCYNDVLCQIRKSVIGKKIFVSIDETCDVESRNVANVIVGTMQSDEPANVFLLTSEVLEKVNYTSICKLFNTSMSLLWPDGLYKNLL